MGRSRGIAGESTASARSSGARGRCRRSRVAERESRGGDDARTRARIPWRSPGVSKYFRVGRSSSMDVEETKPDTTSLPRMGGIDFKKVGLGALRILKDPAGSLEALYKPGQAA